MYYTLHTRHTARVYHTLHTRHNILLTRGTTHSSHQAQHTLRTRHSAQLQAPAQHTLHTRLAASSTCTAHSSHLARSFKHLHSTLSHSTRSFKHAHTTILCAFSSLRWTHAQLTFDVTRDCCSSRRFSICLLSITSRVLRCLQYHEKHSLTIPLRHTTPYNIQHTYYAIVYEYVALVWLLQYH